MAALPPTAARSSSSRLAVSVPVMVVEPVTLPPGRLRLATSPSATAAQNEDHWNGRRDLRRGSLCNRRGGSAERGDDIDPQIYQFVRHCPQPVIGACRPAIFDAHVLAFDITGLAQTPNKRVLELRRGAPEYAHYRHRRMLPARAPRAAKRPRRRAA